MAKDTETLEEKIGEKVTVGLSVEKGPNRKYTGVLVGYDGEHYIFDDGGRKLYISRHIVRFPN